MTIHKTFAIAASALALGAAPAAAAVVTGDLNLRSGPGTEYRVIASMPEGAQVNTGSCSGNWCHVNWRGYSGYASASYLSGESRGYVRGPRNSSYDYYDYPRYRGPGFGLFLNFGDRDRIYHRRHWNRW
ncbi:MAG: SH3 domain-containing protein [Hyphomicrobiales bacterium]